MNIQWQKNASSDKINLWCVVRQAVISAQKKAGVSERGQVSGLKTIEIHRKLVEHRCSMAVQGQMDTLAVNLVVVSIINLTAKRASLSKFMIVANESSM